jgi:hypothetical protein
MAGQLNYATNPFIVNNWALQGTNATNAELSEQVNSIQADLNNLKTMVVYDSKTVKTNNLGAYTANGPVSVFSPLSLSNVGITINDQVLSAGLTIPNDVMFSTIQVSSIKAATGGFSTITVIGDITYGGSLIHNSDARLKQNIRPYEFDADAVLRGLNPVRYNFADGREEIGLLAQDVLKVVPECVSAGPDGILGVDYAKLVVVLLKIIKDKI